ncbi:MAG TPA: ATP-binding protein [Ktedonobacteraceae bacterium]|nr:ATP-binding protein [Ktedonobacteraceae bacterium]
MYEQQATTQANTVQLEAVFEAMADSVFLYDAQCRLSYMNLAARRNFSIDMQPDYTSRSFYERLSQYHPRDEYGRPLPPEQWPINRVLHGEVLTGANAAEMIMTTVDGREIQANLTGAPIRDADGRFAGAVFVIRDVTERRQLERRVQDSLNGVLAMAETLVHVPSDVPLATMKDGEYVASIAQTMRQLLDLTRHVLNCLSVGVVAIEPETEMLRPVATVGLPPEHEHIWYESTARISLSEYVHDAVLIARLHANEVVLRDVAHAPLYIHLRQQRPNTVLTAPLSIGNQLIGLLSLNFSDYPHQYTPHEMNLAGVAAKLAAIVIERERLMREYDVARASEMALRESNRRMDEFLSMASHELRTPLTSIKGNVQLAERSMAKQVLSRAIYPDELVREHDFVHSLLVRADHQTELLNRLVGDLLDVSRIQADKFELHLSLCDLASIVRNVIYEQRQIAPDRDIILEIPVAIAAPVNVDVDRIVQVIMNYITNALKYSEPDSVIHVCMRVVDNMAYVAVRDEGPGLSPDDQVRVWERFYQVQGITVKSGSSIGLGLGLHICRTIIARHSGKVGVQSAPEKGSTFWFALPIVKSA